MLFISLIISLIAATNCNSIDKSIAESRAWIISCRSCADIMFECSSCLGIKLLKLLKLNRNLNVIQ